MDKKQAQMKQQIAAMMRKKDYYDILGIQKTAAQTQIKKAYKKLALKFHPDKNSVEGSKQVFKKVSNAYTVLINPQQKERYDRFGPQQQQQTRFRQQHRGHHTYHTGDEEFEDYDDIFRAFFGMNAMNMRQRGGPGFRTYTYNMGGGGQANAQGQRQQGIGFHYLFILIFLFYVISPFFKSAPYFSFSLNSEYRYRVNSDILNTQYYVRDGFWQQVKKDATFKRQIDLEVDSQYLGNLKKTCQQATRLKQKYQYTAYQYSNTRYKDQYKRQAEQVDLSSCKLIDRLYKAHPDYVTQIYYYR